MDEDLEPVWTPVHRSLIRPDLVFGCERGPVIFLVSVIFVFIVILQKPLIVAAGILMLIFGIPLLRYLAKRDPMMYRVWSRHFSYQSEYPMHPSLLRPPPAIFDQQRKKGSTL